MQRLQAATRVARGAAAACGASQEPAVRAAMSARAAPRKALALRTARPNVAGLPAAREQHVPALRVAWQKLPPCASRAFSAGASEEAEPAKPIEVTIEKVAKSETPQVATRAGTPTDLQAAASTIAVPVHDAACWTTCCGERFSGAVPDFHWIGFPTLNSTFPLPFPSIASTPPRSAPGIASVSARTASPMLAADWTRGAKSWYIRGRHLKYKSRFSLRNA